MGVYEIEIHGAKVKVSVINKVAVAETKIAELRASLERPVVGVDAGLKLGSRNGKFGVSTYVAECVVLFGGNRGLIIQLCLMSEFPASLRNFLVDETICFVHKDSRRASSHHSDKITDQLISSLSGVVRVCDLAVRVLKKASLKSYPCGLQRLGEEVGLNLASEYQQINIPWKDTVFTSEQIQDEIEEAYICYKISDKLLSMLDS